MKLIFHLWHCHLVPPLARIFYAHKKNYSIFLASTERSELDETIEKTFRGIKMEQNHLLRGNQYFTFCSHAEFSKNGIISEHFGNKTGKTGTILFQAAQNIITVLLYKTKNTLPHYRNLSRCGGISILSHYIIHPPKTFPF